MTKILVIIVNYRTAALTKRCLKAVARERETGIDLSAILVDGCSDDGSVSELRTFLNTSGIGRWTELLPLGFNGGFGWANNQAILRNSNPKPSYIYLLNPDTEIEPGAIAALAQILDDKDEVGAVGSQLLEPDGSRTASAFSFPSVASEFVRGAQTFALSCLLGLRPLVIELDKAGPVDWVSGASVMLRFEALNRIGLFDDGFFLYFEEVELMHRLKRFGKDIWFEPRSRVFHIGGASTGVDGLHSRRPKPSYWFRSRQRYFALTGGRWKGFLANLAWLAGFSLVRLPRLALSSSYRSRGVPGEFLGMKRAGLWPTNAACRASVQTVKSTPNRLPFWTQQQ
ncbi:glycosyltransferase family 2 protein [Allopontixanthobacter sediminis]|uniref:Glycosyltransferase n=1 Tax=Allopontixanthobacter sediminis TaxID=1689985 RepID=A0A845B3A1_9SPHN|nr:glycosyltransferase family 2 protein [Allopontixanthobacter sediminis]MXP44624.1 glycosyltransferase [Allopontixanthobacter sediminis]